MHSLITYIHPHTYVPTHTQIHTRPQKIGKEKRILQLNRKPKLYFLRLERMALTEAALSGGTGGVGGKYRLGLIGPSQWTSAVHELSASSTKQTKETQ